MIDPRDYAEAIARATPARLSAKATGDWSETGTLYEIWMNDRLMVRLPKYEAVAFLDGMIAGINLRRGWNDNSGAAEG